MTGGAVARYIGRRVIRKVFPCRIAPGTEIRIMTVAAVAMHLWVGVINYRRRIVMAVGTACVAYPYQVVMTFQELMNGGEGSSVADEAVYLGAVDAVCDCLTDGCRVNFRSGIVVAEEAVGTVQGIDILLASQGAGAGHPQNCCITGMTVSAEVKDDPVVVGIEMP